MWALRTAGHEMNGGANKGGWEPDVIGRSKEKRRDLRVGVSCEAAADPRYLELQRWILLREVDEPVDMEADLLELERSDVKVTGGQGVTTPGQALADTQLRAMMLTSEGGCAGAMNPGPITPEYEDHLLPRSAEA